MLQLPTSETYPKSPGHFVTAFLCGISALTSAIDQTRTAADNAVATTGDYARQLSSVNVHGSGTTLADFLSLYRLDFKLNDTSRLGSFLLRPADHSRESRLYTPVSRHTADNEVLQLARYWVRRCNGHQHANCRDGDRYRGKGSFLPTRLIELPTVNNGDLGATDELAESNMKLVETASLDENNRASAIYVTLSHRWGNARFTRLLKKNKDDFSKSISFDALPQTFRDAISLAARLERNRIRYIWIDSLCIVQDDPEDWLRESVQMFEIYAKSYCNISATAAMDGTRGLFFPRDPQNLWEDEINVNTAGLLQEQRIQKQTKLPRGYSPLVRRCEVFDLAFWDRLVEKSPVNRRAWVLQERLLAPRVLHFCEDQIAWECPEHDAAESFPDGLPKLELKGGNVVEKVRLKGLLSYQHTDNDFGEVIIDPEQTSEMVHDHWKLVVERYSTTGLSHESDKLIALAGIAQLMANRIRGKYVAGMWEKYLASQLTWRVKTAYENGRLLYPSRRPKVYRAPTFSWASVDAPQGVQFGETKREKELWISVRGFEAHTQTESAFGPLKKPKDPNDTSDVCFVDVDCLMAPVKIELNDSKGNSRYECRFWREPEPATAGDDHSHAPRTPHEVTQDSGTVSRQNGSAEAGEAGDQTHLEQDRMPYEVPFGSHHEKIEQAQTGAEPTEAVHVNGTTTHANGTAVPVNGQVHSTRPPTAPVLQHRMLESKSTVGVYMDCPEDDGERLESTDAESYCLPVSTNAAGDLICLLVQRQRIVQTASAKDLYRRVGLLTFPVFLPDDQKLFLEQAGNCQAQIRLI